MYIELQNKIRALKTSHPSWIKNLTEGEYDLFFDATSYLPKNSSLVLRKIYFLESHTEIMKCPICNTNIIKYDSSTQKLKQFCSMKCRRNPKAHAIVSQKTKMTTLKKYGDDYYINLGKKNALKSDIEKKEVAEKRANTNIEKFGVSNPWESKEVQEQIKNTNLERYGVEHAIQSKDIFQKGLDTKLQRYGDKNFNNSDKNRSTCVERYGYEFTAQVPEIRAKMIDSWRDTYRKNYWDTFIKLLSLKYITPLFNKEDYISFDFDKGHKTYKCLQCDNEISMESLIPQNIYCPRHTFKSKPEFEINQWLLSLNPDLDIQMNKRFYYDGKKFFELDVWLPEFNIGIEYHGLYWHSDLHKSKFAHQQKWNFFHEKNIQVFQIFESEWINQKPIVQSIIQMKLKKSQSIFARKCEIKSISNSEYRSFLVDNHIQGYVGAKVKLGLYHNGELVQLMSFSKSRFNKSYEWENIRTCTKIGFHVAGGFSKLLTHFKRDWEPENIITYIDLRYFNGQGYINNEFQEIGISSPNYFYFKRTELLLDSRIKYQKHKLKTLLDIYDDQLSEYENMIANDYLRIYDAGNKVLSWTTSQT